MKIRIDAHQHFWEIARGDYGWLTPALGPIYRDFQPGHLIQRMAPHGIGRTILVQAAPTEAETHFLLDIAANNFFVGGVVGWTDFEAPDAPAAIARLAADPLLVGLRPMVQDIADDDWLLRPALAPAFTAMIAQGLVFDALVLPRHLPRLKTIAERYPALTIVIDHAGKPDIAGRALAPWEGYLEALSKLPNTVVKLSGLPTQAAPGWRTDDLAPYGVRALAMFGPNRTLFGSDWPVVEGSGGYDAWFASVERMIALLPERAREAVLGDNAARVYLGAKRGRH